MPTPLQKLAKQVSDIRLPHPVRVGIDGVDAAGKTIFADKLAEVLADGGKQVIRASVDGFHNPKKIRYQKGRDSAEGYYLDSFNNAALAKNLLKPLGQGGNLKYRKRVFDFKTDSPAERETEKADQDAILIFEGVFLFRPELNRYWDYRIFIHADFNITLKRAAERDRYYLGSEKNVIEKYNARYIPGQKLYLSAVNPKEKTDVIINNNDFRKPEYIFV